MSKLRFIAIGILLSLVTGSLQANDLADALVEQALYKYAVLEKFNDGNDLRKESYLNEYVIELDPGWKLDPNWIQEAGAANRILSSGSYDMLSRMLRDFNDSRKDALRFYVIVVNDYQAELKETIDLSDVRGVVDNLYDLVRLPDNEKEYARFRDEISGIPQRISDALYEAGYEDRLIYFYGVIRLYKLGGNSKLFKYDNLSVIGDAISPAEGEIRDAAKRAVSADDTQEGKIEGLVAGIINAVQVTIDNPDETVPHVDCGDDFDELVNKTRSVKEKRYRSSVLSVAELLDHPTSENQRGSPYLIVDKPDFFSPEDLFTTTILPDRLSLLAHGNSEYRLYVVFKEVDFILSAAEWKEFAEAVYEESDRGKESNTIVVIVPYYATVCVRESWLFPTSEHTGLLMPGVYCADAGLRALMNSAFAGEGTWEGNFNQAFSHIPKRYVTYDYKFLWNGDLIIDEPTDHGRISGKASIYEVRILEDERFNKLAAARNAHYAATVGITAGTGQAMSYTEAQFDQILEADREYSAKVEAILNERPQFLYVGNTNLVESRLSREVADEFAKWYCGHKKWSFLSYLDAPDDEAFYGGRNPEKIEDGLMLIDIASGVASLFGYVGADAIFDGLGAYYAYSNGKYAEAAFYGAAASVPFLSGALRRAVMEGGAYMLKKANGMVVSMPRGVLGANYLFRLEDAFSQYLRTVLNVRTFNRAAKYKLEKDFVNALEDGMIADAAVVKALNENPSLVDDFYVFFKDGKGTLKEFFQSRIIDFAFIDNLGEGWSDGLKAALKSDIEATPELRELLRGKSDAEKVRLVESWRVLEGGNYRTKLGALELFSDPSVLASRRKILDDGINQLFPNIPVEELAAIRHYTTNAYTNLNRALRSGNPSDYFKSFEEMVNNGLSKLPKFNGDKVFRGVKGEEAVLSKTWKAGDNVNFKDFKSTTTSPSVANDFAGDVVYEISNPKGHSICSVSCLPGESEVLFKSGSNFKVKEVKPDFVVYDDDFNPFTVRKIILEFVE